MNNAITEIKSTLEGTNSRIIEAEDRVSEVEDRIVQINGERKKEKRIKGNEDNLRHLWTMLNAPTFSRSLSFCLLLLGLLRFICWGI